MGNPVLTVYGHPRCPMVLPIRHFLNRAAVPYTYINIDADGEARRRVRHMNAGNETVPTLVFGDGTILREPTVAHVQAKLLEAGTHVPPLTAFYIQYSVWIVLVGCLLVGMVGGGILGSAVLGGGVGLIAGFVMNSIRIRRAGS